MVRRLPAQTAVVDFVERWEATPPANSVASIGRGEKPRDALPVGSFWKGEKRYWNGGKPNGKANPATLKITERRRPLQGRINMRPELPEECQRGFGNDLGRENRLAYHESASRHRPQWSFTNDGDAQGKYDRGKVHIHRHEQG